MSLERRRWPNFASWLCSHSPQQAPFIPSPALCCAENGHRLLLQLLRAEMVLFLSRVRSEWDAFHFLHFFPSGYAGSGFFFLFLFSWVTKKLLEEGEGCCYVTLCCLISLFFMFISWLSQQLSRGWTSWSPTVHCRAALVWHSSPFIFFPPPYSCLWAGQRRPESLRQ